MLKRGKMKKGFSLVEIVIAVAVIGIMSAAVVPLIRSTMDKSRKSRADSELTAFRDAAASLYADTDHIPFSMDCTNTTFTPIDGDQPDAAGGYPTAALRGMVTVSVGDGTHAGTGNDAIAAGGLRFAPGVTATASIQDVDRHLGTANVDCQADTGGSLYDRPNREMYWRGPYLTPVNRIDPWGNGYIMLIPGTSNRDTPASTVYSYSTERPAYAISAGEEEGLIHSGDSGDSSISFSPQDIGKRIILR